jgi:glycine cleavage system regulatory protein
MSVTLVVTVNGVDRPGVVARVAAAASECGASWQESGFSHLAGRFAGVVSLSVPDDPGRETLERALRALEGDDLHLTIERGAEPAAPPRPSLRLELVGHDRPGIVREISMVLARHGVNIEELETEVESASMSGELLFRARAALTLPPEPDLEALRHDLETIANELMADLHLDARPERSPEPPSARP